MVYSRYLAGIKEYGGTAAMKPSQQNIHMRYFEEGAYERAQDIPEDATITDMIKDRAAEEPYNKYPALIYHVYNLSVTISREKFNEKIDLYAKALDAIGVKQGECVAMYGPFVPEMGYIVLALIQLGAWTNILQIMTPVEDSERLTRDCRFAVVFDGMGLWHYARDVFADDRFTKVIVVSPSDAFGPPLRPLMNIYLNGWAKKFDAVIPQTDKYLRLKDIEKLAKPYAQAPRAPSDVNRIALATGSSGSTGATKCSMVTNRAIISNVLQIKNSVTLVTESTEAVGQVFSGYGYGQRFLSHLPFLSTSLSILYFLPLLYGMTVVCDPMAALTPKNFADAILKFRPSQVISTGSESRGLFKFLDESHDTRSLDFVVRYIIGGDAITNEDYYEFLGLLGKYGVKDPQNMLSVGWGLSECFGALTSQLSEVAIPKDEKTRLVTSVGIPFPATTIGIFDDDGNELDYGQRGEIWVNADKTPTVMAGYYMDDELNKQAFIKDANGTRWFHTNDIGEFGSDGQLYYYCRKNDFLEKVDGDNVYTVDIANYAIHSDQTINAAHEGRSSRLSFDPDVRYCYVSKFPTADRTYITTAHIVLRDKNADLNPILIRINEKLRKYFPDYLVPVGYRTYDDFLPESVKKLDRKLLNSYLDGYVRPSEDGLVDVTLAKDDNGLVRIAEKTML